MSETELGESLVGAYLRHIEGCQFILYNSFTSERQGEVDVVGIKRGDARERGSVFFCEATTHTSGMNASALGKVEDKLDRAMEFAERSFPDEVHYFQWWSPIVAVGKATELFAKLEEQWNKRDQNLVFVINEEYTRRVSALVEHARTHTATTGEPAFRLLQILTRLRGEKPIL